MRLNTFLQKAGVVSRRKTPWGAWTRIRRGLSVERLLLTRFGPIALGRLQEGRGTALDPHEMEEIRRIKARMLSRFKSGKERKG